MKKLLTYLLVAITMIIAGCSESFDDSKIWDKLDDHESRITKLEELCQQMNTNISSLQTIVTALQNNDYVTGVTPITENGKTIGYTITFAKSQSITIYHGKDGQNGADGKDSDYLPTIGVKQETDGIYYWTLNGEWLLDANGNKIKAQGTDGKDGANGEDGEDGKDGANGENGADGITPQLKIENDYWYVSYDNGASWTQLGKATGEDGKDGTNGTDGTNGADGKSFFQDVTQDENNVYFTLADGMVITVPKGLALSIEFAESDLVVMSPNSTREIGYTITSATESVKVEVTSSADIKAKAVADNANGLTGKIHITTGAAIDEYSKVIVFVSNGEKVIMRSITFEEAGLVVEENATKQATAEGGEVVLEFLSNVECKAVIPEDAQSWISVVPATRAMEKQTITLKLEPNAGYYRSATVIVQSTDGTLKLEYQVEQDGDLGVNIDPTQIPDNEIWYVTDNGEVYDVERLFNIAGYYNSPFDAKIISNTYHNGYGIIKFDNSIKEIHSHAFGIVVGNESLTCADNITDIYMSNCVEKLSTASIVRTKISRLYIPDSLNTFEIGAIHDCRYLEEFVGNSPYISEDKHSIIINGTLYSIASYNLNQYTIPSTTKHIADFAAYNCSLERIILATNVQTIGESAFAESKKLREIVFNENLEVIKGYAFNNSAIEALTLPNSLKEIWGHAFGSCDNLEEVYLPNNLIGIGNCAFSGKSLRKILGKFASDDNRCIIIDKTIKCFAGRDLTNYAIPDGVVNISNWVFANCDQLQSVQIPESVVRIGDYAFQNCLSLSCNLPSKLEYIGEHAFRFCGGFKEITIPDSVTQINGFTFANCDNLQSVTLSPYVTYIGSFAFGGENVKTIFLKAYVPPTLADYALDAGTAGKVPTIYVPEQTLTQYKNHSNYSAYKDYIVGYQYNDLPENDTYISSDYSQDGAVTTLQTATKGNGIDIVLMGDAYSDRQIADGTYKADMENLYNNLFTEEPYKSFKDYFDVYYVNVVSANEGYEYGGGTAIGGYFGDGTLVGGNDNAVLNYALKAISEEEMDEALLIVAMNSDNYAGTCYMYYPTSTIGSYGSGPSVSYFSRGGDAETFAQLLHHEACGHGFAKLADEYAYEGMGEIPGDYASQIQEQQDSWGWWKNVDFTSDPTATRWSHFINDTRYANEGLGAYEGGLTYWSGVWRPTENSIMRYNTGGFNAPSREAIYYRIHKLAYGDSWEYDYEEFAQWDARNRATAASRAMVYKPTNYKPTHPPVFVNKSWRDVK